MESSEARIRSVGRRLLAVAKKSRRLSASSWLTRKLMEKSMSDPLLKTQLFRLVDVLPALKDNAQIAKHVREYLDIPGIPFSLRLAARAGSWAPGVAGPVVRGSVRAMASTFMAGENVAAAIGAERLLEIGGMTATYDLLGEAVVSEDEAARYMVDVSVPLYSSRNVSVKLSSLSSLLDPADPVGSAEVMRMRLHTLAGIAVRSHSFLNLDMEDYRLKDLTLKAFSDMVMEPEFRGYRGFGIVLQAYLRDCQADVARMTSLAMSRGTPFRIRLVKGAYWDHEVTVAKQNGWPVPVFESKSETDANYEHCSYLLMTAYPHVLPAFASHNVRSVSAAIVMADSMMIPKSDVEFQGLYGMADGLKRALVADGRKVRVYLPYGRILPGMSYLVRRLLENTSNESFLRRESHEGLGADALLANPRGE